VQVAGSVLSVAGLLLLSGAGARAPYASGVLPGLIVFGVGIIAIAVPAQISAIADIRHEDAGAASGVVTTAYQVGGAIGLAVVTTLSQSRVAHSLASGHPVPTALTNGYHYGLLVAAAFAAANLVTAVLPPATRPTAEMVMAASAGA
jgi:hypothetical protein